MNPIQLYWWRERDGRTNFGDDVSPVIVERLSGRSVRYADLSKCDMLATGSLLDRAQSHRWQRLLSRPFSPIQVWGSGSFGRVRPHRHMLDFHAVRGPATRDALGLDSSMPLGDPALLLAQFINPPPKKFRWGIIPHLVHRDEAEIVEMGTEANAHVIDLADPDVIKTAREIAACDFVISSSLHGIIVADAFGVPNVWMETGRSLVGGRWKFADYFASVDRPLPEPVRPPVSLRALEATARSASADKVAALSRGLAQAFTRMNV